MKTLVDLSWNATTGGRRTPGPDYIGRWGMENNTRWKEKEPFGVALTSLAGRRGSTIVAYFIDTRTTAVHGILIHLGAASME